MARAFAMPYKFIIIILLIIICWSLCSASSREANKEAGEEPFTTMYDKANDRANPLASSQTPLKNVIPTGINEGAAASLRQMNQIALNIPTADANGQGTFSQTAPTNMVSPRIDNEGSFLGMVKFCKDHAAANNDRPFDDPRFNENCGMCVTSGTLIDKTTFDTNSGSKATGVLVYQNDKKQFWKEKDDNKYPFTHAIPSLNSATCFGAIKGTDASPALAISQADYDKFRKRSACMHGNGNGSASSCGTCMTNNTKSWIDMAGGFKTITMLLWGSGNAKVSIGGNVVGQKGLSASASASFPLGLVPEDTPVQIEVNPLSSQAQQLQPVSLFGAIYATTPSGGEYRLAIDEFLEMDASTGSFPRAGLPRTFRVSQGDVSCVELKPQPSKTKLTVTGPFPLTFVDSDQLASHDCPVGPYIMNDTNVGLFTTTDPCLNPKGQSVDNYTDGCLRATLTGAGCSTEGSWYGDLDLLRTDYKGKSTAEMKTGIDTTSRRDKAFMLKCFNQDLSTPCDPYLPSSPSSSASAGASAGGIPNQACMTYLYTNQSAQSDFVGAAYSGTPYISNPSGTQLPFCQSAGSLNPASAAGLAQLQSAAQGYKGTTGIPAVKSYLTDVFTKSTGTLPQNLPDAKGGRYDSWGACIGTAVQVATTPGSMNVTATPGNRTVDVSWTTPNTGGATITGYTVTYTPSESGGMVTSTGTNSATITGLRNAVTYTVRVVATNVMGESSGTTTVAPVQPVCATAGQMVPFATSQCSSSTSSGLVGMWQKYIFGSDSNGACTQEASGNRVCNSNCPGATSSGVSSETTPLYLLDFTDPFTGYRDHQFFLDNKAIAVKLFQGPHTQNNNEQSIVNPVKKGMKVTWAGNTTPATVMDVGVSHSNPRGLVHHVIYITLDKQVNTSISTFTLLNAEAQGCAYVPCSTAGQLVPANNNQCDASGMRQNYIFKSDVNGACVQDASGARWCDATCPSATVQGGCAYVVPCTTPLVNRNWRGVCSSANGQYLVAVSSPASSIYRSSDYGSNWNAITTTSALGFSSVASDLTGQYLIAGGKNTENGNGYYEGYIYTSQDYGSNWTVRSNGISNAAMWAGVASGSTGNFLVAAASFGHIYTSSNYGSNWTQRATTISISYWSSVCCYKNGNEYIIYAGVANGQIQVSTDSGASWREVGDYGYWLAIACSPTGRVVAGSSRYSSGASGYITTSGSNGPVGEWRSFAVNSTGQYMVAGGYGGPIYTSSNYGSNWTPHSIGLLATVEPWWNGISSDSTGRFIVAVNGRGGIIYKSKDYGSNWSSNNCLNACANAGQTGSDYSSTGMRQNYTWADSNGTCVKNNNGAAVCDSSYAAATAQGGCGAAGPAGNRGWKSVASSSDGVKLVALDGQIYTSTDSGASWALRSPNTFLSCIASSSDGVKLVCASYRIFTSTDSGSTWNLSSLTLGDSALSWSSIASSSDGVKLVAVNTGGTGNTGGTIYTSTDSGVSWTQRMTDLNRDWVSVASSSDGVKLVALVNSGGYLYTSTDSGVTWTPRAQGNYWRSVASSADGVKLVALDGGGSGGYIYTSTNSGLTWTNRESIRRWTYVASSSDGVKLVAVDGYGNYSGGQIYTSTDSGVTWTPREGNRPWRSVTSSSDGRKLAAVEHGGFIYTSTDFGVTWRASASNSLPLPPYVTSITARTTTGFTVNWDGATGATSYTYAISPSAGTSNANLGQLGSGSVTWTGLSAGVSYTVTITSTNAHGSAVRTVCANAGQIGSDCSSTGMRQNYTWADSNGSCVKNNNGAAVCDSTCPNATAQGGCAYCSTNPSSKPGCPGYVAPCPSTTPGCPGYVAPVAPPTPSGVSISSVDWANGTVTVTWNPAIVTSNPELNVHYYVYSLAGFGIIPVERTLPASATSVTASGLIKTSQIMQGNTQEGAIFSLWAMNSLGKYGANAGLSVKP